MDCPKCNIEMDRGFAIKANDYRYCFGRAPNYDWETLKNSMVICWKCPTCGHSEYMDRK